MKTWVAVGLVLGVIARFALADDDSDRADAIRTIDSRVKDIAGRLSGFDSQRDYSKAEDALSYAREVSEAVRKLERVKGSDSRANDIVSRYPGYIDSFREATKYLKKLKELQFLADGVADRCTRDEADLQTLIRNYVGRPDEAAEAFDKLPAKGQEYARTYAPLLDKLKDANSDFNSNASYARFDVSTDNWSDVRSYFNDASQRMQSYWKDRYSPIDAACKRLALGEKHPDLDKALSDLRGYTGNAKQTVKQLKVDYNVWLRDARALRDMTVKDHAELRESICTKGVDEEDIAAKANAIADRWASQISSAYGTILGQSDRLGERAASDKLKKYKGAKEVLEGVRANRDTLAKVKDSDLQGSNNPKIKVKMKYGTDYHASWSCSGKKEFKISSSYCGNPIRSGSNCIADCVVASGSTCTVIELKPDNAEAMRMGDQQREAYARGLERWYREDKDSLLREYGDLAKCVDSNGTLVMGSKLETYRFCPDASEAEQYGPKLEVSSDVSESE